jgi:hypothetical protein
MEIAESFAQPVVIVSTAQLDSTPEFPNICNSIIVPPFHKFNSRLITFLTSSRCFAELVHLLHREMLRSFGQRGRTLKPCSNQSGGNGVRESHLRGV